MSDLIRRQDAIAVLSILADKMDSTGKTVMEQAIEVIRDLRSAQKTGEPLKISKTVNREEFENIIKNSPMMLITPGTEKIELIREQQWIPCSERLPEEDANVLVTVHFHGSKKPSTKGSYYVEVANQIGGEWCSYSDEYKVAKDRHEVIAWMSLPAPYTEEEQ